MACIGIVTGVAFFSSASFSAAIVEGETFVHLFEWRWDDIAKECQTHLKDAGFRGVQISPPNEHVVVTGKPWWQRYQPVSYLLESRGGDAASFRNMVETCAENDVDIYVDAVINHMSGIADGQRSKGSAGSDFGHYDYPGYSSNDFHFCGTVGNDIDDYSDKYVVQNCELLNLADLKTGSHYVQERLSTYLASLVKIGVKGFRIDAAKHIPSEDLSEILTRARNKAGRSFFVFQEVIDLGMEPIRAEDYFNNGRVTEFWYSRKISEVVGRGKLDWLNNNSPFGESWGFMPSSSAVVFVDNHDNQRGHGGGGETLTHKWGARYVLANVLMLSWPYGYPKVMSSFSFEHSDQGPPTVSGELCRPGAYICEHRWPEIRAMVQFRKHVAGTALENWWSNGNNQVAYSLGDKGFVALNNESSTFDEMLYTGMADGKYRDILATNGELVEVKDGYLEVSIPPYRSLAIISE